MNWKINLNKFSWQPLIASAVRCAVAWIKKLKASLLISLIENGTKDERGRKSFWIPQDHICHSAFWHPSMNGYVTCTYIIFSYTRKVGDQKKTTRRWEEIIFNGNSPQICHTLWSCLFDFAHASSIQYLFNNDNVAVSRTWTKSPHLHKITFPETGKYENFQFTEWKNVFHARNKGKCSFSVFCSRATKAIKIY